MINSPSVFNSWVPNWIKIPLLVIALFPHLFLIGVFNGNASFIGSIMDTDINDLQFVLAVGYAAIVVALLVNVRLFLFLSIRNFIITVVGCSILLLLIFLCTQNFILVSTLRVLQGFLGLLEGVIFFPVIMSLIKSKHARAITYFILYALMLSSGPLTGFVVKLVTGTFGWDQIFYLMVVFHCLVLLITLYLFNGSNFFPYKNLVDIDWSSCLYLLLFLVSGAFCIIYGFRLNWFHSPTIWYSIFISLISLGLFLFRQATLQHKLFHLEVFTYKHVQLSIVLFVFFYFIRYGYNTINTTMVNVWKWPWENVIDFQFLQIFGVVLGVAASGYLYLKSFPSKIIFAVGFLILSLNAYALTTVFDSDVSTSVLIKIVLTQGFAHGWLFTPLVMYIINGVPPQLVNNATMAATGTRFWITNAGFALAQNLTYNLQEKHFDTLKANFDPTKAIVADEFETKLQGYAQTFDNGTADLLTQNDFANQIYQQAYLVANKEMFTYYFWAGLLVFSALVIHILFLKINAKKID